MNTIRGYVDKESDADKVIRLNKKIRSMHEIEVEHTKKIKKLEEDLAEKEKVLTEYKSYYWKHRNEEYNINKLEVEIKYLTEENAALNTRLNKPLEENKESTANKKKKKKKENKKHPGEHQESTPRDSDSSSWVIGSNDSSSSDSSYSYSPYENEYQLMREY